MRHRPTTFARLNARLRDAVPAAGFGELPDGFTAERTRNPRSELANGAWSWQLHGPDGIPLNIGSQWPAVELLRFRRWTIERNAHGELEVDPDAAELRGDG